MQGRSLSQQKETKASILVFAARQHSALAILAVIVAVALSWFLHRGTQTDKEGLDAVRQVATAAFAAEGLQVTGDIHLMPLDAASQQEANTFAAIAEVQPEGLKTRDIGRVTVQRAPESQPVRVAPVFNLTRTENADERVVNTEGPLAIISVRNGKDIIGLLALDFSGESPRLIQTWGKLDRWKNLVSNWQESGQTNGIGRQRIMFDPPHSALSVIPKGDREFELEATGGSPRWMMKLSNDLTEQAILTSMTQGAPKPEVITQIKGQRPHLGWLVDSIRDLSWVGPTKIARLEDVVFTMVDWGKRQREAVLGPAPVEAPALAAAADPATAQSDALLANIPSVAGQGGRWRPASERRKARTWPPPPGKPVFSEPGPGEGKWVPMTRMIKPSGDKSVVFYQSWVRPDTGRGFAHVSVTAWDPSRIQLGTVAGTREPESKTGIKGTGQIPRKLEVTPRVVAAFNGGFQSKHCQCGMVADSGVVAPPMGAAATVAGTADGRTLMGQWPAGEAWKSRWQRPAGVKTPKWIASLRQNIDTLVDGNQINPTGRRKWGNTGGVATASGVHTVRTGLCLMEGGAMAYLFGVSVSAEMLGKAMIAFNCEYGMHLDMNSGHSGFEFYNVKDIEAKDFEASKMIQDMWHMNYPRYIKRDGRDYMYLTHRILPLERLADITGLAWRHPAVDDAKELAAAAETLTAPGEPARVLLADLTLGGGESHVELIRLPRQALSGARHDEPGEGLPTGEQTVMLGNTEAPEGIQTHLDLSAEGFGTWRKEPAEGSTIPAVALVRGGGTEPLPEDLPETTTVMAIGKEDLILTITPTDHLEELVRWLLKRGFEDIAALPCPTESGLTMRLVSEEGEEAFRGGPLRRDRTIWTLDMAPRQAFTGRVEDVLPKTDFADPRVD